MNNSRLDQLLKFLEEDPGDPFTIYAVAMEYSKTDMEKAASFFNRLLADHPGYVPAYYHAGKLFERQGYRELAEKTYARGMEESRKAGNHHAFSELQSALNQLRDEEED